MSIHFRSGLTSFSSIAIAAVIAALGVAGCSAKSSSADDNSQSDTTLKATIGPEGGELIGTKGSSLEGVHLVIPAGAVATPTDISVKLAAGADDVALPATAVRCGPTIEIEPAGLKLATPALMTVPFDETTVETSLRLDDEVKVWVRDGDHWGQQLQTDSAAGAVTVELDSFTDVAAGVTPVADVDVVRFKLAPNPKFVKCLAQYPDDPKRQPSADVIIVRGDQSDSLQLRGNYLKPNLNFDMFTVQNSQLKSDGTPDPAFTNFGLAWYQSDLEVRGNGEARVTLRTILLDQIFGFDPAATLPPTSTLHLGFWFNDPKDAAPCGFDVTKPTPFNGDHLAGPLAMITLPNATTNLGPLCTKADTSVTPARCSP